MKDNIVGALGGQRDGKLGKERAAASLLWVKLFCVWLYENIELYEKMPVQTGIIKS